MVLGVTGGIGSGKSYICHLLEIASFPVFYCDEQAKRLLDSDIDLRNSVIKLLGDEAYSEIDGKITINKKYVAGKIFSDSNLRLKMNALVHPAVFRAFEAWKESQESNVVVIESAILFESGLNAKVDKTVVVSAPMETRIERLKKRDSATEEEIQKRIESQCSDKDKLVQADYIITNGPLDDVNRQIFALLDSIQDQIYSKTSETGLVSAAELPL